MANSPPSSETRKRTVPAVARAARLLDVLAAAADPMRLAVLAKALELPRSTVHGLCATLVDAGLVTRFQDGTYHLGVRIMDLAHAYLARTDLTVEFAKILSSEAPIPEESVVLSVLDGADIVYVACRNGSRPFGFNFRFGMRLPANCAASGRLLSVTQWFSVQPYSPSPPSAASHGDSVSGGRAPGSFSLSAIINASRLCQSIILIRPPAFWQGCTLSTRRPSPHVRHAFHMLGLGKHIQWNDL